MTFEFNTRPDETVTVSGAVYEALGAASMCWSETPHGVFDSVRAAEIGEALEGVIAAAHTDGTLCTDPHLGLAMTQQLLDELTSRIRVDYFAGGGGLDYSTVKGRPDYQSFSVIESAPEVEPLV